jgi:electron transfer flavoprotein alpha subunit
VSGEILVVAEHVGGRVRDVTNELVSAARGLGGRVVVAAICDHVSALDLAREGVDEIVHVRTPGDEFENDVHQAAVESLVAERQPDAVLVGFTVNGLGYAAAVAANLGLGFASDVFGVSRDGDALVATRAFYGGKVHAELELPACRTAILMLRPTVWPAALPGGSPPMTEHAFRAPEPRARHVRFREVPPADVDITSAPFLLSIGRGIGDRESVPLFEDLAQRFGATLAVSRPIVDAGWVSNVRQVGQSGRTVKPKVYLAFGISGAVQHLAGMKSSETIIAVNRDPEAAIFEVAHYGAVADLFDVAEELAKLV